VETELLNATFPKNVIGINVILTITRGNIVGSYSSGVYNAGTLNVAGSTFLNNGFFDNFSSGGGIYTPER
jgi:hypothetical protein